MKRRIAWSLASMLGGLLVGRPALADPCAPANFRILVDVGHSQEAPGALSARGQTEYTFNKRVALQLAQHLKSAGFTQTSVWISPGPLSLPARAAAENAAKPDLLISIHHDSVQPQFLHRGQIDGQDAVYSDHAKGWSLFVSEDNKHAADSRRFATYIADRLLAADLTFSKHHAEAVSGESRSFLDPARGIYRYDGLVVLKQSEAPAVLLETGVIVNPDEEAELNSPARINATISAVAAAVGDFCADAPPAVAAMPKKQERRRAKQSQ